MVEVGVGRLCTSAPLIVGGSAPGESLGWGALQMLKVDGHALQKRARGKMEFDKTLT